MNRTTFVILVLLEVFYDTLAIDCLMCYQCASYSYNPNPYCDSDYLFTLTEKKREKYIVGCKEDAREFCMKKTTFMTEGQRLVERGCVGGHDKNGLELKRGCMVITGDKRTEICFCTENLCNSGYSTVKMNNLFFVVAVHCFAFPVRSLLV